MIVNLGFFVCFLPFLNLFFIAIRFRNVQRQFMRPETGNTFYVNIFNMTSEVFKLDKKKAKENQDAGKIKESKKRDKYLDLARELK